jgi:hypothetical protein
MTMTKIKADEMKIFHDLDDVFIPSTNDFGYVFAIAIDVQEALVVTHDGKDREWFPFEKLLHLEAGSL